MNRNETIIFSRGSVVPWRGFRFLRGLPYLLGFIWGVSGPQAEEQKVEPPFGLEKRIPWTTSRLVGSPDPPLPFTVERAFPNINWQAPMHLVAEPGTDRLFAILHNSGDKPARIVFFENDPAVNETTTLLKMPRRIIYSVEFDKDYVKNNFIYVFSNLRQGGRRKTNRISRFVLERDPKPHCDLDSEQVILEWRSQGHDGGGLAFGHDGMLYITTGDGTSDSDEWVSGQTLDDLLGAVLRIDVRNPPDGETYGIPEDNPFVDLPGARPEIWAYGLRNPWRLCVDAKTGHLWTGNNGQDLWETAYLVRPGENYGWSVYEGSHPFYQNRKMGPHPLTKPTIEHPHSEARSLTGGVVYYGEKWPELEGFYIYGDYGTGWIWGARHDGESMLEHRELADTSLQIAGFCVGQSGEMLVVDHAGGIYRFVRTPKTKPAFPFPIRLSETGLFHSVENHQMHPALIPYSVNSPGWHDGAQIERFMALPGDGSAHYNSNQTWKFPDGTALFQTLSLDVESPGLRGPTRVESRVLLKQQGEWVGYSYRWNAEQTEAVLVGKGGKNVEFVVRDPDLSGGERKQQWHFPSRAECMVCHSRAAGFVLGITGMQLNRNHDYGVLRDNQLRALRHIGLFSNPPTKLPDESRALVDPLDPGADLEARVRSYLHVNCSICHIAAGGGNSQMEMSLSTGMQGMNLIEARPQHDTFGISNAMLVAPGSPERSVLFKRISRRGRGQMPPVFSNQIDTAAVNLIRDWISELKPSQPFVRNWQVADLEDSLDAIYAGRSFESGKAAFRQTGCSQCHQLGDVGGSVGPDLTGTAGRMTSRALLEAIIEPSKKINEEFALYNFSTEDGKNHTGRIWLEDSESVTLGPLSATTEPVRLRRADIRKRQRLPVSNMPPGTLNTLPRDRVQDLLAYLAANGDSESPLYTSFLKEPGGKDSKQVAAIVTEYRHNSHADIIVSRLLQTYTLDGKGEESSLKLGSLYTDQKPANDTSRMLAASHRFPVFPTIEGALTLGTGALAVDGVLLIAEHGDYPMSPTGNRQYPKRRFWEETLNVFRKSGRVVPVFVDKHLADNWEDAKFIYDSAQEMMIPLMAGSSLPTTWRLPPVDVRRGQAISEIVAITYGSTDAYAFHALEFVQSLAEQRRGGETGIVAARAVEGEAVWTVASEVAYDPELFEAAWKRLSNSNNRDRPLREMAPKPKLLSLEYTDGLRVHLLELNGAAGEWSGAWRYTKDRRIESSLFWTQEGRPGMHFTWLLNGIEQMMLTGKPEWNVERTLLTSGALDALLTSLSKGGQRVETPWLNVRYKPLWRWAEPPPPPPMRPWSEQ